MRYGERIRVLRELRGLTQAELAEKVGISTATIGRVEQGVRVPRMHTRRVLATFFYPENEEQRGHLIVLRAGEEEEEFDGDSPKPDTPVPGTAVGAPNITPGDNDTAPATPLPNGEGGGAPVAQSPIPRVLHTQAIEIPIAYSSFPDLIGKMGLTTTRSYEFIVGAAVALAENHGILYRYEVLHNRLADFTHSDERTSAARVEVRLWLDGQEVCRAAFAPGAAIAERRFPIEGLHGELRVERRPAKHPRRMMAQRLVIGGVTVFDC